MKGYLLRKKKENRKNSDKTINIANFLYCSTSYLFYHFPTCGFSIISHILTCRLGAKIEGRWEGGGGSSPFWRHHDERGLKDTCVHTAHG